MKIYLIIGIFLISNLICFSKEQNDIIIDSDLTFEEAIKGTKAPKEVIDKISLLNVEYYSTDGKLHHGQLIIDSSLKQDITEIFEIIKEIRFPVEKVIPIVKYYWSDDESMSQNNSSSFNYRFIAGTERLSKHALGRAVDINPFFNPVIYDDGSVTPKGAKYDTQRAGTFSKEHPVVQAFLKRGWRWGGDFKSYKDNHHFDKE
jgi:peptidoglycan LD-endopeptidase CwlK